MRFFKPGIEVEVMTTIEFVKHYQAHLGPIHALVASADGQRLVTTSADKMIKFFDIQSFDMANMISVEYTPTCAVWIAGSGKPGIYSRVAVADADSGKIRLYEAEGRQEALAEVLLHSHPVRCMGTAAGLGVVVSADTRGLIEYWDVDTLIAPAACSTSSSTSTSASSSTTVSFRFKTETDLYELAKAKTTPCALCVAPAGDMFAVYSRDKMVRVFDLRRGKLTRVYNESVQAYQQSIAASSSSSSSSSSNAASSNASSLTASLSASFDSMEIGRKLAVEKELEASPEALGLSSLAFDESGNFLIFGSLAGIKVLNLVTNKVSAYCFCFFKI